MSSHTYMLTLYAVKLDHAIAKSINENHFNESFMTFVLDPEALDNASDEEAVHLICGVDASLTGHPGHSKQEHEVYTCGMFTHNENPYVEVSTEFDSNEDIDHYFGICLADSGFGDKVGAFREIPQEAIDNYKKYAMPILERYGIKDEPELVIVQQTR